MAANKNEAHKCPTQRVMHAGTKERIKKAFLAVGEIPTVAGAITPEYRQNFIDSVERDLLQMAKVIKANKKEASEQEGLYNELFDKLAMFGSDLFPNMVRLRKPKESTKVVVIDDDPLDF